MGYFNRIKLRTPESVELEFTLAGIGNRTLALLIDYLIWGAILLVLLLVWNLIAAGFYFSFGDNSAAQLWLVAVSLLLAFAVYVGYFVFFETLWHGQTPGKRYAKIRVVREDGKPAGLSQATLRSLLRPLDDLFFIGALMIVLGSREKRLGDWVAGTIVIEQERPTVAATFPVSDAAQPLSGYLLENAEIARLLPDDFAVIRSYLQQRSHMTVPSQEQLSQTLTRQVKDVIVLQELPAKTDPNLFLEAVYLAYQQQSKR